MGRERCTIHEKALTYALQLTSQEAVPASTVDYLILDMGSLATIATGLSAYSRPDGLQLLILNAGIMNTPYEITVDGYEAQFQVNHLGHFYLVRTRSTLSFYHSTNISVHIHAKTQLLYLRMR